MPPPTCAKCRQAEALEGDTWCLGCSSWDALGRELSGHWDVPGARVLAADLVVSCVRQVRGLRGFAAGLVRQAAPPVVSGSGRETPPTQPPATTAKAQPHSGKRPLPVPPPPPRSVKGETYSEEEEEDEEEEDEEPPTPCHRPLGGSGGKRPPEPDRPPAAHRERRNSTGAGESRASTRGERSHREEGGSDRRKRRRGHRGGRKHQRLHRLGSNPLLPVHRQLPSGFWELGSIARGRDALDRL